MGSAMLLDTSKFEQKYTNACNAMHELDNIIVATGKPLSAEELTLLQRAGSSDTVRLLLLTERPAM